MNPRIAILTILIAVATSAATTTGIMAYQAGRLMDRVADSMILPPCDEDCTDALMDDVTKDEQHQRVLDALKTMKDETLGREI